MNDTPETTALFQEMMEFIGKEPEEGKFVPDVWNHARKLERQRDALLEALRDLHDAFQFTDESPGQGEAILRARKAIEEAEK